LLILSLKSNLRAALKTRFVMRNRYLEKGQGILANLPQMQPLLH